MISPTDQNDQRVTNEDLYGKSDKPSESEGKPEGQIMFNKHNEALVYEETPIIEPVDDEPTPESIQHETEVVPTAETVESEHVSPLTADWSDMPTGTLGRKSDIPSISQTPRLTNLILLIIFFVVGIGGLVVWRARLPYLWRLAPSALVTPNPVSTDSAGINIPVGPEEEPTLSVSISPTQTVTPAPTAQPTPTIHPPQSTPTPSQSISATYPPSTYSGWVNVNVGDQLSYDVPPISLQLPPDIKALVCDPPGCASQGTELAGKTRFTISFHRFSKSIENFQKAKITDAAGRVFPDISYTSLSGKPALEYSGRFNGTTTNGFGFTQMHGVMILLDPRTTMEINHFTQSGKTADFNGDDSTYIQILKSVAIVDSQYK